MVLGFLVHGMCRRQSFGRFRFAFRSGRGFRPPSLQCEGLVFKRLGWQAGGDELGWVRRAAEDSDVIIASTGGKVLRFACTQVGGGKGMACGGWDGHCQ